MGVDQQNDARDTADQVIAAAIPVLVMAEKFVQGARLRGIACERDADAIVQFRAALRGLL